MRKKVLLGIVVALLFFVLIIQVNVVNATNSSNICGDVNGDNTVNGTDLTYLGRYLNGMQGYTITEETADVNDDGVIDWNDYSILKKHIAEEAGYEILPKAYPCGDVNRDYIVNATDITYLGRNLNGNTTGYPVITKIADVNDDGIIDWKDYSILKKHVAEEAEYENLPKPYECGDINRDYVVNATDITYLGRNLNGNTEGYPVITKIADVNNDGIIDWKDYSILKKHIAEEEGYEVLPKAYSCGDINRDYVVNATDVTYLGRYLNGNTTGYPVITKIADVNDDGIIDWKDYSILKKHVAEEAGYEELPKAYTCGDVNRDYAVNGTDVTYLGRYLNGINGYDVITKLADTNDDGVVDWKDYSILKKHIAGDKGYETLPYMDWNAILNNATTKHPNQTLTNDIAIGTDGKLVNLDLWTYNYNYGGYMVMRSYTGEIVNGSIQGTIPQYIKLASGDGFAEVKSMYETFYGCTDLTNAPTIPTHVIYMQDTFANCTNLLVAPEIPTTVTDMNGTFNCCENLTTAPAIPASVTNMNTTFMNCYKLTGTLEINASPDTYMGCFNGASTDVSASLVLTGSSTKLEELLNTKSSNSHISILKYDLTFMLDNEVYARVAYRPGEQTATPTTPPTKTGYIFDGWFESDLEGRHNFGPMINENVTVYGKWIERIYTINYDANGGTGTMEPSTSSYTNWIDLPPCDYTYSGHNFLGWDTHSDVTEPEYTSQNGRIYGTDLETMVGQTDSVTLYAIWEEIPSTYRITYKVGEVEVGYTDYAPGANIITIGVPSANVPEGQYFDAWCEDPELTRIVPTPFIMPEENITVYARFTRNQIPQTDEYTITYNKNSETATGEMGSSIFFADSNNVPISGCAYQNTGYRFKGWATDATGTHIIITYDEMGGTNGQVTGTNLATYATNKQVTLYAVWEIWKHNVTISGYGEEETPWGTNIIQKEVTIKIQDGKSINESLELDDTISPTMSSVESRPGYSLDNYYKQINGIPEQTPYDWDEAVTEDTYIIITWTPNTYTFTYDLNGGTLPEEATLNLETNVEYESSFPLTSVIPEMKDAEGKAIATFCGWTSEPNTVSEFEPALNAGDEFYIFSPNNTTVYALWLYNATTIVYDLNGGESESQIEDLTIEKGTTGTLTSIEPTLQGRTFIGWAEEPDVERAEYQSGEEISNQEGQYVPTITAYAIYAYNTINIIYDLNGGTVASGTVENTTVNYGGVLTFPTATIEKEGYTFKGWDTISEGVYDGMTENCVVENIALPSITLYAVWSPNWYENGAKEGNTITYTISSQTQFNEACNMFMDFSNKEEDVIINTSGDLELNVNPNNMDGAYIGTNTTLIIGGSLRLNDAIGIAGTLKLKTGANEKINISGSNKINVVAGGNLIIDDVPFIGNQANSSITMQGSDTQISFGKGTYYDMESHMPVETDGYDIEINMGVATINNSDYTETGFTIGKDDVLRINYNTTLIVDQDITIKGQINVDGILQINEGKTITIVDDGSIFYMNESSITGLGTLIDNSNVYITYNYNNGTPQSEPITVKRHENYTLSVAPTWEGNIFKCWEVPEGNLFKEYAAGTTINFDNTFGNRITINAIWEPAN